MKPIAECDDCRQTVEWATVTPGIFRCNNCHSQVNEEKLGRLRNAHQRREDAKDRIEAKYQEEVDNAAPTKNR